MFSVNIKGHCIGFLLLCIRSSQTWLLKTTHMCYFAVSVALDCSHSSGSSLRGLTRLLSRCPLGLWPHQTVTWGRTHTCKLPQGVGRIHLLREQASFLAGHQPGAALHAWGPPTGPFPLHRLSQQGSLFL